MLIIGLLIVCLYLKTFISLFTTWRQSDYYSYAFLIPLVSAFLVWLKRKELRHIRFERSRLGLGVVLLGLFILFIGTYGDVLFLRALSFVVLLSGVILHLFGKRVMRLLRFPILFLIFMVPAISVLEAISLRLQLLSASFASLMLGILGMPVVLDGLKISVGNFSLMVEMPCSGLSSLLSMSALASLYVYLLSERNRSSEIRFKRAKEVAVLLSVVPAVLLANSFRIAMVALVGHHFGENVASGFFHFGSGLLIFLITLAILIAMSSALGLLSTDFLSGLDGFRETSSDPLNSPSEPILSNLSGWRYFSLITLLVLGNVMLLAVRQPAIPEKPLLNENTVPLVLGHWRGENRKMMKGKCINKYAEVQIFREYIDEKGNSVWLVLVYSRNRRAIYLPERLYQAYGYNIVAEGKVRVRAKLNTNEDGFDAKLLIVEKGEERETVLYLLTNGGKVVHSLLYQQLSGIWDRLTNKGKGWTLVRVSAPSKDKDASEVIANLTEFLELLIPKIVNEFKEDKR